MSHIVISHHITLMEDAHIQVHNISLLNRSTVRNAMTDHLARRPGTNSFHHGFTVSQPSHLVGRDAHRLGEAEIVPGRSRNRLIRQWKAKKNTPKRKISCQLMPTDANWLWESWWVINKNDPVTLSYRECDISYTQSTVKRDQKFAAFSPLFPTPRTYPLMSCLVKN